MLNIKRPYVLLVFTGISLFALVFPPVSQIDFEGKTMFNAPLAMIAWIIPLVPVAFWLLYLLTKRFLYSLTITWIHILITVLTTILMVIVLYLGINPSQPAPNSYYDTSLSNKQALIGNAMRILSITFVCGQFAYVGNILLGIFLKGKINRS